MLLCTYEYVLIEHSYEKLERFPTLEHCLSNNGSIIDKIVGHARTALFFCCEYPYCVNYFIVSFPDEGWVDRLLLSGCEKYLSKAE